MRVSLIGSDCEENLGLCMIGAALVQARHRVDVVPFSELGELESAVERVLEQRPKLVGLGMQFQHRACDFLYLANRLRESGYKGHITCGGQYPTMAWAEILAHEPAVDSVVLYEGEESIVELCSALSSGRDLDEIPGLALRTGSGGPHRTAPRHLVSNLDELPFAHRYRAPVRHLGIPFRPIWGSRGCWGACAFCSITSYYRDAREHGKGRALRLRSPENLAAEMAALWHAEGGLSLFCFHDDTLLLPRTSDTLERLGELRRALDQLGVGPIGIIGKGRPDCVTPELALELRKLGVVRMFVGVENGCQRGLDHLNRRTTVQQIEQALAAYQAAGIFVCYNLLLFEPDSVLDDVRENIAFIRRHAHVPVNFCRAEPYHGTPLYHRVRERGSLLGSHLGWDYRIDDDRTELVFRMAAAVFRERNYDPEGVANRTMGLGYTAQLLRCFYQVSSVRGQRLLERAEELIRSVSLETADFLEQVVELGARIDLRDHDRALRETALLGLRISAHNRAWHAVLDQLNRDLAQFAAEQPRRIERPTMPERARAAFEKFAMAGFVAASLQACGGDTNAGDTVSAGQAGVTGTAGRRAGGGTGGLHGDSLPGGMGAGGKASDAGSYPVIGGRGTGGRAVGGYLVVDMAPLGGMGVGGRATGGRATGGIEGDGGSYPVIGGRAVGGRATGGIVGDGGSYPIIGGRGGTGGSAGLGTGGAIDAAPGGMAGSSAGRAGAGGQGGAGMTGGFMGDGGSYPWIGGSGGRAIGGMVVDCAPTGGSAISASALLAPAIVDPAPSDATLLAASPQTAQRGLLEHWRDTSPRRMMRSPDLVLFDPPVISLESRVDAGRVQVTLCGGEPQMSVRWQSEGTVTGEGREVVWQPASADDALCVAVRSPGGVAIASLRASELG